MIFKNPFSVFESLSLFHLIGGTLGTRLISAYLRERICIHLFQKTLSERTANGSCRTEIARPRELWFPHLVSKNNVFFAWPETREHDDGNKTPTNLHI